MTAPRRRLPASRLSMVAGGRLAAVAVAVVIALAGWSCGPGAGTAWAQTAPSVVGDPGLPPGTSVVDRPRPEYDPLGIRLGGFILNPKLMVNETYDDNITAVPNNKQDDFITTIAPSLILGSDWNNHYLGFRASGNFGRYASHSDENYDDYGAGAAGRLDIRRSTALGVEINADRTHEARTSETNVNGTTPTKIDVYSANTYLLHRFNRLSIRPDFSVTRYDYHDVTATDGTLIDNGDRNRTEDLLRMRLGYQVSDATEPYLGLAYNWRRYSRRVDSLGFQRDSQGWQAVVGSTLRFTNLLFGDVYLGWQSQHYDDPAFGDVSGPSAGAKLTWNVTRLTSLEGSLTRAIYDAPDINASGYWETAASLRLTHELRRNVLVAVTGGATWDTFQASPRTDRLYSGGLSLRYLMMRNLYLNAGYDYLRRNSDTAGYDFTDNRFTVGLSIQF